MVDTGLLLKRELPNLAVPIVLTGAMTPLGFEGSDGLQNLTESLLAARLLSASCGGRTKPDGPDANHNKARKV